MAHGATATPAEIKGAATTLNNTDADSLYADATNERLYVTAEDSGTGDPQILVFDDALTAQGNIAPDRTIVPSPTLWEISGVELDETNDRLYVFGEVTPNDVVLIYDDASTLDGATAADQTIILGSGALEGCLHLDTTNDRLYVLVTGGPAVDGMIVYDNASTLTSASAPSRLIVFTPESVYDVWVDGARDRMYVCTRSATAGGDNVFVFAGAATLNGVVDLDADSDARFPFASAIAITVDARDRLYVLPDGASSVSIYESASTMAGNVTAAPRVIHDAVDEGYGLDTLEYMGP
jgi:hypothetical protein